MTYKFSFEKLNVWVDSKEFPTEERFGLTNQLRRSSISVSSNLAEGTCRSTNKDKAHFTTLSFSSLMELLNQIIIANELDLIKEDVYNQIRKEVEKISNKLNALRKSQLNS